MKKRTKIIVSVVIFIGFFFLVGGYFINKFYHEGVKSNPVKYCYQTYFGPANSVIVLEDLDYKEAYLKYYSELSKGANPSFDFPLKTLPQYEPVYVMGYSEDGLLADVVSYYDRGSYFGGSYLRGWVYSETLHDNPPPKKE